MDIACELELGLGLGLRLIHFAKVFVQSTKEFWFSLRENIEKKKNRKQYLLFFFIRSLFVSFISFTQEFGYSPHSNQS